MTWKAKNVCWTINNPTFELFISLKTLPAGVNYTVYQVERGRNGTLHLQGYTEATSQKTQNQWKQYLGITAHLESRKGSQREAIAYCKKNDDTYVAFVNAPLVISGRYEYGSPSEKKTQALEDDVKDTTVSMREISEDHTWDTIKHHAGIMYVRELQWEKKAVRSNPEIYVYYGGTGMGKSYHARTQWPDNYKVVWPTGGRWWWPNYDHQEVVILDEFRMQVSFNTLIQLLDAGKYTVETKGGNMFMTSTKFVITTNHHPKDWYEGVKDRSPLFRRLIQFGKMYEFKRNDPTSTEEEPVITEFQLGANLMKKAEIREWDFGFHHTEVDKRGNPENWIMKKVPKKSLSDGSGSEDMETDTEYFNKDY